MTCTPESDISIISFYASHVITAGGTGGMLMVNDEALKVKALQYRDWGRTGNNVEDMTERFGHKLDGIEYDFKFTYSVPGYNMKACEMNAAFGLAQMKKLPRFLEIRRKNVERYIANLQGTSFVLPDDSQKPNWLAFPLQHSDRKKCLQVSSSQHPWPPSPHGSHFERQGHPHVWLTIFACIQHLEANDIQTRVCFAGNVTRHPAFRQYYEPFPVADEVRAVSCVHCSRAIMSGRGVDTF